jgi:hypothetical protein
VRLKRSVERRGSFIADESGRVPVIDSDESFYLTQRGHHIIDLFGGDQSMGVGKVQPVVSVFQQDFIYLDQGSFDSNRVSH